MVRIKRALLSVSDKTGIVTLAKALSQHGVEILSTGGTARLLAENGIKITEVGAYTGFPEMLDGRVKTLHPKIHGGILARRELSTHMEQMKAQGFDEIDLVCVNLYPFNETIAKPECSLENAIENIDIGGPTMVRSAAKNWTHVTILTSPSDYDKVIHEMAMTSGLINRKLRFQLAKNAFAHTAAYDAAISNYLTSVNEEKLNGVPEITTFPERFTQQFIKIQDMRYGENPHQKAAFYRDLIPLPGSIASYKQLQGKELSYNNIADADTAWEAVKTFPQAACVIIKHANPCGIGVANSAREAYHLAFATDSTSAFGGIIAFNCEVDGTAAEAVTSQFLEVLIAPSFTEDAKALIAQKPNVRVIEIPLKRYLNHFEFKRIGGGLLLQTPDNKNITAEKCQIVTKCKPTEQQLQDLLFAWKVIRFVKSNAIVFAKNNQTCGIGAGQMSRVDSTIIAVRKAQDANLSLTGAVAASDAFFPFKDGVEIIAEQGIKAIIQPGGSMRDEEVIATADQYGIAMIFTGIRHFRH